MTPGSEKIIYMDEVSELRANPLSNKSKLTRKKLREVAVNDQDLMRQVMEEVRRRDCRTHLGVNEVIHSVIESVVLRELDKRNLIQSRPDRSASLRHVSNSPPRSTVPVEKRFSYPALPQSYMKTRPDPAVQPPQDDVISQLKHAMTHSGFLAKVAKKGSEVFFSSSGDKENERRQRMLTVNIQTTEGRNHFLHPIAPSALPGGKDELINPSRLKDKDNTLDQASTLAKISKTTVMSLLEKAAGVLDKSYQGYDAATFASSMMTDASLGRIDESELPRNEVSPAISSLEAFLVANESLGAFQHRPHVADLESHVTDIIREAQEEIDEDVSLLVDFPCPHSGDDDDESFISGYLSLSQGGMGHLKDGHGWQSSNVGRVCYSPDRPH